jgi:hypothetical protein
LHYWVWKLFDGEDTNDHKKSAIELYQSLSKRTKKYSYLERLKELS